MGDKGLFGQRSGDAPCGHARGHGRSEYEIQRRSAPGEGAETRLSHNGKPHRLTTPSAAISSRIPIYTYMYREKISTKAALKALATRWRCLFMMACGPFLESHGTVVARTTRL